MEHTLTLKAARINRGLTCKEAADALGVTPTVLYNLESGRTSPKVAMIDRLVALYAVPYDRLRFPQQHKTVFLHDDNTV